MKPLKNKTILITGGNKGIGYAIALKCAREGANIVIVAKEKMDENLTELTATHAKLLTLQVDLRDENAADAVVKQTIQEFGSIDVLINNAAAFCFADTLTISAEKFDLLFAVNIRAAFLLAKLCLPYLQKANNPHIINIAPPLDMQGKWFKEHLAFTMSKYSMSMCTLGMAAEFKRKGVAVNSLWPQTTIATSVIQEHFAKEVYAGSRYPSIMADAALILMQKKAKKCSGNFFIDEVLLRETGVSDFSHYAVDPNAPLIQDLFIPDAYSNEETVKPLIKDLFFQSEL